ncbi:MAG: CopG family transcriptional regulator, partial [Chloroflexota bacterium]
DIQRRLREVAKRTGRAQADLVRTAINRYLADEPSPLPGSIGFGDDAELRGRDTEDWLRANWRRG